MHMSLIYIREIVQINGKNSTLILNCVSHIDIQIDKNLGALYGRGLDSNLHGASS